MRGEAADLKGGTYQDHAVGRHNTSISLLECAIFLTFAESWVYTLRAYMVLGTWCTPMRKYKIFDIFYTHETKLVRPGVQEPRIRST